jgi:two-component system, LuxR family, response regulator FixJ
MANEAIVYVIDDDEAARHSLEFLLDCAGIRVRSFVSADAFLAAAPPLADACIVTDVRMPGRSGIELIEEMGRRGASIPVIVITGHADVPLAIQAMHAGVADFIEKPFDDATILTAIRKAIAQQASETASHRLTIGTTSAARPHGDVESSRARGDGGPCARRCEQGDCL